MYTIVNDFIGAVNWPRLTTASVEFRWLISAMRWRSQWKPKRVFAGRLHARVPSLAQTRPKPGALVRMIFSEAAAACRVPRTEAEIEPAGGYAVRPCGEAGGAN